MIWSTILHITSAEYSDLGYYICNSLFKKTNQIWMINRLVGTLDQNLYNCYSLLKNSSESYLVLFTSGNAYFGGEELEGKVKYIMDICKVFNKQVITLDGKEFTKFILENGGNIVGGQMIDSEQIANDIIDLHCGGKEWRKNKI